MLTEKYIVTLILYLYEVDFNITDDKGGKYSDIIHGQVSREITKIHEMAPNPDSYIRKQYSSHLEAFINISVNIISSMVNAMISDNESDEDGNDNLSDDEEKIKGILEELRDSLYSEISNDVVCKIDGRLLRYQIRGLYFLKINNDDDSYLKENIYNPSKREALRKYLIEKSKKLVGDEAARCLFNVALLFFYDKNKVLSEKYYDLATQKDYSAKTVVQFNLIVSKIGWE